MTFRNGADVQGCITTVTMVSRCGHFAISLFCSAFHSHRWAAEVTKAEGQVPAEDLVPVPVVGSLLEVAAYNLSAGQPGLVLRSESTTETVYILSATRTAPFATPQSVVGTLLEVVSYNWWAEPPESVLRWRSITLNMQIRSVSRTAPHPNLQNHEAESSAHGPGQR